MSLDTCSFQEKRITELFAYIVCKEKYIAEMDINLQQ